MTKKLEQLFDLPDDTESQEELSDGENTLVSLNNFKEDLGTLEKINSALPAVRGLEASDSEMDDLASKAVESYENLMDLGMQVESRFSSEIFSVAGQMLNHAITAKTAKTNKKLKMLELQLKQARLQQQSGSSDDIQTGNATVIDRNELLQAILNKDKKEDKSS